MLKSLVSCYLLTLSVTCVMIAALCDSDVHLAVSDQLDAWRHQL